MKLLPQLTPVLRFAVIISLALLASSCGRTDFTEREKTILESLSLDLLGTPSAESNKYAFSKQAQQLGEQLFNDKGLSRYDQFSCASCHPPNNFFIDGLPTGVAAGTTTRNTPSLQGVSWQSWFYWDGRRDSLWSQALTPIEAPNEMAGDRVSAARLLSNSPEYRQQYESIFGTLPFQGNETILSTPATPMGNQQQKRRWIEMPANTQDKFNTVFANVGKAISAYQHTLAPANTRFDKFIDEIKAGKTARQIKTLNKTELEGAHLFLNEKKTQCLECHNGPLLSNGAFHNIATGNFTGPIFDFGREFGSQAALLDEFNCQGRYSDAQPNECMHLIYMNRDTAHMRGAFKTPSLRNITNTAPYFHDGRFTTLEQVVRYYASPPPWSRPDEHELRPGFELEEDEIIALTRFLETFEAVEP